MQKKDIIRIGLVGTGMMGNTHHHAYKQVQGAEVVAVCSRNAQRAARLAEDRGAEVFTSLDELLARDDIDAIDICLPNDQHRPVVEQAATHGKHVFCEKPIAGTVEDAQAMIDVCQRNGVTFMVGHVARFSPDYQAAREKTNSGSIGSVGVARLIRSGEFPSWNKWFANYERSGGPLLDLAIHDFDFLLWCFGSVKRVFSRQYLSNQQAHALTLLRFHNDVMAHVETSWAYPPDTPLQVSLEIAGSEGLLHFERDGAANVVQYGGQGQPRIDHNVLDRNAYVRELQHFVDCIRTGRTPLTSGDEALASLRVSLAAIESVRTGEPVNVEVGT